MENERTNKSKKISHATAIKLLGREQYLACMARATFHNTTAHSTDDYNETKNVVGFNANELRKRQKKNDHS